MPMKCPYCNHQRSYVVDTRTRESHIRRRRKCKQCKRRFITYERAALVYPTVVKQDGRKESFDRDKLVQGIRKACAGRAIALDEIEAMADWVVDRIQGMETDQIASRTIGELVLQKLQDTDPVAYLLFASVYLPLPDLHSVNDEIERLRTRHTQAEKERLW
jgi:transcriptional repressor NrdR